MNFVRRCRRAAKATALLLMARWRLDRHGFAAAWAAFAGAEVAPQRLVDIGEATRDLDRLGRRLRLTCLPRSLALCSLLRGEGHHAVVRIGVRREAGKLLAHAWVELDEAVLGETLHPEWQTLPMEQGASIFEKVAAPTS